MKRKISFILAVVFAISALGLSAMLFSNRRTKVSAAAPDSDGFKLVIGSDGTVSNGVSGSLYTVQKSSESVTPAVGTDSNSGNKYIDVSKDTAYGFYQVKMQGGGTSSQTLFWKSFGRFQSGNTVDLSFTWEVLFSVPEMPASEDYLMCYSSSDKAGFGIMLDDTQAYFFVGNGRAASGFAKGANEMVKISFGVTKDTWYHAILSYDDTAKTITAYVNGEKAGTAAVSDIIPVPYDWSGNYLNIGGSTMERINRDGGKFNVSSKIGIFNFSDYAVTDSQAADIWETAAASWKLSNEKPAPVPGGFQMVIASEGTVSNGVSGSPYTLQKPSDSVTPTIGTDAKSGNKYVDSVKGAAYDYYQIKPFGSRPTFFWNYYDRVAGGKDVDLNFTWEILFSVPEMASAENYLMGYGSSDNGGFGLRLNDKQAIFFVGNGKKSAFNQGANAWATISFDVTTDTWYHAILTYDDTAKAITAYVNGVKAGTVENIDIALVSYNWNANYVQIGGGSSERMASDGVVQLSVKTGIFNWSDYKVSPAEAQALYNKAAEEWKLNEPDPTEEPTQEPTQAPTEAPTEAPTQAPTDVPATDVPVTDAPATDAPATEVPTSAPTAEPQETEAPQTGDSLLIAFIVILVAACAVCVVINRKESEN